MSRPPEAMEAPRDHERDLGYVRDRLGHDPVLARAYADARSVPGRPSISPEAGRLLEVLVRLTGATRILEIGAGAGYSGIWIARGLAPSGRLETIELSEENADVCRANYEAAGVAGRVEILLGAALEVLPRLEGPYDLCFMDAVKSEYPSYLDHARRLVRPGGAICADNVLWQGTVSDPSVREPSTDAVREFNRRIFEDPGLVSNIVPVGDGLSVSIVLEAAP